MEREFRLSAPKLSTQIGNLRQIIPVDYNSNTVFML